MMELRAKEPYKLTFDIKAERERTLSSLPVTFQVSPAAGMGVNSGCMDVDASACDLSAHPK